MTRYIKCNDYKCGRHRLRCLMRVVRLVPIHQEPSTRKKHPQHKIWPYLLKDAVIGRPNQVWCLNITYIPKRRGFRGEFWIGTAVRCSPSGCKTAWMWASAGRLC
jgi:putative transposase